MNIRLRVIVGECGLKDEENYHQMELNGREKLQYLYNMYLNVNYFMRHTRGYLERWNSHCCTFIYNRINSKSRKVLKANKHAFHSAS